MEYIGYLSLTTSTLKGEELITLVVNSDIDAYLSYKDSTISREVTYVEIIKLLSPIYELIGNEQEKAYHEMIIKLARLRNVTDRPTEKTTKRRSDSNASNDEEDTFKTDDFHNDSDDELSNETNLTQSGRLDDDDDIMESDTTSDEILDEDSIINIEDINPINEGHRAVSLSTYEQLAYKRLTDSIKGETEFGAYDVFSHNGYHQLANRAIYKKIHALLSERKNNESIKK
jgi:hypothetical protein